MKRSKQLSRDEMIEMAKNFNRVLQLDPPIDLTLSDDALSDVIVSVMLDVLPEGSFDLRDGQELDSRDIAIEEVLCAREGTGPQVFPVDGKIDTENN